MEGGGGQRATYGRDTTVENIHWQKAGDGGGAGGHPDHI